MKIYEVKLLPMAEADLFGLYEYISAEAGPAVAGGYIDRIEAACASLAKFPARGRARDDIRTGLRVLGFERRVLIAFFVRAREVVIARILYGGRDYEALLSTVAGE